jgi:hypothetical protein
MAFKQVTRGNAKYWINLDQVAYIRQHEMAAALFSLPRLPTTACRSISRLMKCLRQIQTRGFSRYPDRSFTHRIFEGSGFRIVLLDPPSRGVLAGKDLQMIDVARQQIGVDVYPDCFHLRPPTSAETFPSRQRV